jgi:hypothetical protein
MTASAMCRSLIRPAALVALLALTACARPTLVGTWVGRDEQGVSVVYSFHPDGTGSRTGDGGQVPLRYELREGYPNLIEIEVGSPTASQVRRGLVRIHWDGRMRMELGPAGGPAPEQLTSDALVLRQRATR